MTKIDLQQIGFTDSTSTLINSNSAEIETKSDTFLSRNGATPNEMLADLDMNGNQILNLPSPTTALEPLRLQDLTSFLGGSVSFPADAEFVTYTPSGMTARSVEAKLREIVSVKDFGAVGDDVTNDSSAVASARTFQGVSRPIWLFNGDYNSNVTPNLFGSYNDGLGLQLLLGTAAVPATRDEPILWIEKVTASNGVWDQGAAYFSTEKRSGDAFCVGLSSYAVYTGGEGDLIAIHGRTRLNSAGGGSQRGYAGWFVTINAATTPEAWQALEVNGTNEGGDLGYLGAAQMIRICMDGPSADTNRASTAIVIGNTISGGTLNGFYTGIYFEPESIVTTGSAYTDNGEAIRIDGRGTAGNRIGGARFGAGQFKFATRTDEGTFLNSAAHILGDNQRIVWGNPATSIAYLTGASSQLVTPGNFALGASLVSGQGISTGDVAFEHGGNRTGNGNVYIDFHATSGTDYESRFLRLSGTNGAASFSNKGTGAFSFIQEGAGALVFSTSNTTRMTIASGGGTDHVGLFQTDSLRIDQTPATVGTGAKIISNAADSSTNLGHYLSIDMNGTTYYIPCGTVALT